MCYQQAVRISKLLSPQRRALSSRSTRVAARPNEPSWLLRGVFARRPATAIVAAAATTCVLCRLVGRDEGRSFDARASLDVLDRRVCVRTQARV